MEESIAVRDIIVAANPVIKSLVDIYITPKLESFKKRFSKDYNANYVPTEDHFREYLFRTYKKNITINTIAFHGIPKLLKDIYIPLTLVTPGNKPVSLKIDGYIPSIFSDDGKILVTDTAGMGKSTIVKRLFLDIIDKSIGIPIIIELRRLSKNKTIIQEIKEQLNGINTEINDDLLLELINNGDFIFFLDGFDEISHADREFVTSDIQQFISKADENNYFMTSRPEIALNSFGNFQNFTIQPLVKKEAFDLIRKYDNNGNVSKLLIKKLQEKELQNIDEFLTNPLLVSLLFTAFEHKQVIPLKKHIFYRQVYDANFECHDLTKGDSYSHDKYSKLDIDSFHRVLRYVGFTSLRAQKVEFTKDELLNIIHDAKAFCTGLEFNESNFFKDLLTTVPLFREDGIYYRWAHKSLYEYFAAQFIYLDSKEQQNAILYKLYDSEHIEQYQNLLDIYYDVDYRSFRLTIIKRFLADFKKHLDSYTEVFGNLIDSADIAKRASITFFRTGILVYLKEPEFDSEMEKLIHKYFHELSITWDAVLPIKLIRNETSGYYMISFKDKKAILLEILKAKKSKLVDVLISRTSIKSDFFKKVTDKEILIDLSLNNPINSSVCFKDINEILLRLDTYEIFLNEKRAVDELININLDSEKEANTQYLSIGL